MTTGFWICFILCFVGIAAVGRVVYGSCVDLWNTVVRGERLPARITDLIPETPDIYTVIPYRLKVELTRNGRTRQLLTQSGYDLAIFKKQRHESLQRKWIDKEVTVYYSEERPSFMRKKADTKPTIFVATHLWKEFVWLFFTVLLLLALCWWMVSLFF